MRSKSNISEAIIPTIFGNEEETGMLAGWEGGLQTPYHLTHCLGDHIPADTKPVSMPHEDMIFSTDGAKTYLGGGLEFVDGSLSVDHKDNLERATPECTSVREVATYIRAAEIKLIAMSQKVAEHVATMGMAKYCVRIQRRVIDSRGNRKGCHDNFGVVASSPVRYKNSLEARTMAAHNVTSAAITGAGYVNHRGQYRLSQKTGGLSMVDGYGFQGTIQRVDYADQENGMLRYESRNNDINISDWAAQMRVGGTALALALVHTPLVGELDSSTCELQTDGKMIGFARRANAIRINQDGGVARDQPDQLIRALNFQQLKAELVMDRLWDYTDVPDELFRCAQETHKYVEDMKKVISGELDFSILADRSDWAIKLAVIRRKYEKQGRTSLFNIDAMADDLEYDHIFVVADSTQPSKVTLGRGYRIRDRNKRGAFSITPSAATSATRVAPKGTRATLRASLIDSYAASECDWHFVEVFDLQTGQKVQLRLAPKQTELTAEQVGRLSSIKAVR